MDDQPMYDLSMLDPIDRRLWLLTKGLETTSFSKALALAQTAEDFLAGRAQRTTERARACLPHVTLERSEALEGFSSLVSLDEVIRYLKECDEAVDAGTDNAEELLSRANRKRMNQGLPLFALLPGIPTQTKRQDKPEGMKKIAPPRPPSARERAEWARRVVALPTE
jgi:hypothetical protein